jgi:ABC-type amino acid transport substrate-binding protein
LAGIRTIIAAVALAAVLGQAPPTRAQTPGPPAEARELVVGTKVAPPFAIKAEDGTWRGISIDLWRRIADQTHLRYRFQETNLKGLTDGVAEGSLDAAVAALTVTVPRLRLVDFTQPFYSTGLGITVASSAGITWWPIVGNLFSLGFLRAIAVLFAVSLAVGVVLWLVERRHNEHFGAHRRGLGSSVWWSAVAMTQGGSAAGEKVPVTLPGRLLAIMWMVASVIVIASFTAALTSQLTLKQLRGTVLCDSHKSSQSAILVRPIAANAGPTFEATETSKARLLPAGSVKAQWSASTLPPIETATRADELLTAIRVPLALGSRRWGFDEMSQRQGDYALVAVAATFDLDGSRSARPRLAYAGVAHRAVRIPAAEAALEGAGPLDATFEAIAAEAAEAVNPPEDIHADVAYRRDLVRALTRRVLTAAMRRCPEERT